MAGTGCIPETIMFIPTSSWRWKVHLCSHQHNLLWLFILIMITLFLENVFWSNNGHSRKLYLHLPDAINHSEECQDENQVNTINLNRIFESWHLYCYWLVVWNINFIFQFSWNNPNNSHIFRRGFFNHQSGWTWWLFTTLSMAKSVKSGAVSLTFQKFSYEPRWFFRRKMAGFPWGNKSRKWRCCSWKS